MQSRNNQVVDLWLKAMIDTLIYGWANMTDKLLMLYNVNKMAHTCSINF